MISSPGLMSRFATVFRPPSADTVLGQSEWFVNKAKGSGQPVEFHAIADYAHGPAWTRAIMGDQLRLIDDYLGKGCGGGGL